MIPDKCINFLTPLNVLTCPVLSNHVRYNRAVQYIPSIAARKSIFRGALISAISLAGRYALTTAAS